MLGNHVGGAVTHRLVGAVQEDERGESQGGGLGLLIRKQCRGFDEDKEELLESRCQGAVQLHR